MPPWSFPQGVFRGLGDAKMPLKAAVIACSLNALLDPLLMFTFGLGARGAAWATVAAEVTAALPPCLSATPFKVTELLLLTSGVCLDGADFSGRSGRILGV